MTGPATYRLVNSESGAEPTLDWNSDDLFDGDLHSQCRENAIARAPLWFLCPRGFYVIETAALPPIGTLNRTALSPAG